MRAGAVITIPDAVAQKRGDEAVATQPGLPGKWSIWSQSDIAPGAHFAVPADEAARRTGVKYATVKVTEPRGEGPRVQLIGCDPHSAMPEVRRS